MSATTLPGSPCKRRRNEHTLSSASPSPARTAPQDASTPRAAAGTGQIPTASKTAKAGLDHRSELTPEVGPGRRAESRSQEDDKRRRLAPPEQPCFCDLKFPAAPATALAAAALAAATAGEPADCWETQLPSEVGGV